MNTPEFTGERYIPGKGGVQMAYEHLHRYLFAMRWARGKRVLDVGTGAGYGAALLARCAQWVCAMDLDESTLQHARGAWSHGRLRYFCGDASRMPLHSGSLGLVVALEVLEHLADQEGLVREIARVCSPEGVALISTPNKALYSDSREYNNPFHVREFYREEFVSLLARHFRTVQLLSQQVRTGSLISGDMTEADSYEIITDPAPSGCGAPVEPMYLLALCGHRKLDRPAPLSSAYLDLTDSLLLEWEQKLYDSIQEIERMNDEIRKLGRWGRELEETVEQRDRTLRTLLDEIGALQRQMADEIARRDDHIRQLQLEFDSRGLWAKSLEERVADRDSLLKQANDDLRRVEQNLARIRHHLFYRVLCRLGLLPK